MHHVSLEHALIDAVRSARRIVALTGAGVSAESGVPTFRDALTGLWAKFDPEQLATPQAFARDPELVTRWYDERRCNVARCIPNAGHVALATLQQITIARGGQFSLITQNVDRLHHVAESTDVIELHGSLWIWRCVDCGTETEERGAAFETLPPRCTCGGTKRPGVVWFGESLPPDALKRSEEHARACDLFFSIGTSSVVYPAAGLIDLAMRNGARVIEINPVETPFSARADWSVRGNSGEVLPKLVDVLSRE